MSPLETVGTIEWQQSIRAVILQLLQIIKEIFYHHLLPLDIHKLYQFKS